MLRILLGIMVLLGSSGLLADGNAANGQDLVVVCGACHGQDGNSPAGAFPSLAGQGEKYLYKQMVDRDALWSARARDAETQAEARADTPPAESCDGVLRYQFAPPSADWKSAVSLS